jgi:hypothetical protein
MRPFILAIFLISSTLAKSQDISSLFSMLSDTTNVNNSHLTVKDIDWEKDAPTMSAKLLHILRSEPQFTVLDSGILIQEQQQVVWVKESHYSHLLNKTVISNVFAMTDGRHAKCCIMTHSNSTDYYNVLDKLDVIQEDIPAAGTELLSVKLPTTVQWQSVYENTEPESYHHQFMPAGESKIKYSMMVDIGTFYKIRPRTDLDPGEYDIDLLLFDLKARNDMNTTVMDSVIIDDRLHLTVKAESNTPLTPVSKSILYYIQEGDNALHVIKVSLAGNIITNEMIKKWKPVFASSKVIYQ